MIIRTSENDKVGPELQRTVLLYLAENGSMKWGALYSHFYEEKSDEIGSASNTWHSGSTSRSN